MLANDLSGSGSSWGGGGGGLSLIALELACLICGSPSRGKELSLGKVWTCLFTSGTGTLSLVLIWAARAPDMTLPNQLCTGESRSPPPTKGEVLYALPRRKSWPPWAFTQSGGTGRPKLPVADPRRGLSIGSTGGRPPYMPELGEMEWWVGTPPPWLLWDPRRLVGADPRRPANAYWTTGLMTGPGADAGSTTRGGAIIGSGDTATDDPSFVPSTMGKGILPGSGWTSLPLPAFSDMIPRIEMSFQTNPDPVLIFCFPM